MRRERRLQDRNRWWAQQDKERFSIMDVHKQLLAFTIILLSAQSFTEAAGSTLTYKGLKLKVANADMVPADKVDEIINVRDLLLKKAHYSKDCRELFEQGETNNGLYVIQPEPNPGAPIIVVNCQMGYECGGWTILQQNTKQSEMTWNETWTTYKYGFGNILGDHYIGNEYMHFITNQKWYKARIVIEETTGGQRYAEYAMFRIANKQSNYRLHLGAYNGNAGDSLAIPMNMVDNLPFSSRDEDHDSDEANCALKYGGGWWFKSCSTPNPFAMLTQKENIHWEPFCKNCKNVTLMVRPVDMYCRREDKKSQMKY
uniref:fibrinogen-like protein 1-like protein n=1 Tax=Pristiophorus japonicus TaxID=55135 RepID=UPI00398F4DA8